MRPGLKMLFKVLAIVGAVFVAFATLRVFASTKRGAKVGDALQTEAKVLVTKDWAAIILVPLLSMVTLYLMHNGLVGEGMSCAWLWASIPASSTATVNFTYIPQFMAFTISSAPTSFQINVQGDGLIFNLDATGITNMNGIRQHGTITNKYVFQIANGLINGKNGSVTIANSAAAQLDIQVYSKDPGNMYVTYLTQNALQNSGFILENFAYAAFPSASATDLFTLTYNNGITQDSFRDDLNSDLFYRQNQLTTRYNIDNIAPAAIKKATFTPGATQNIYVMKYQSSSGVVNSAVNS